MERASCYMDRNLVGRGSRKIKSYYQGLGRFETASGLSGASPHQVPAIPLVKIVAVEFRASLSSIHED